MTPLPENRSTHQSHTTVKRRWFRFTLRTLFVVVTVFAGCLAYELHSIRCRVLERSQIEARGGKVFHSGDEPFDPPTIPLKLHALLGDHQVSALELPESEDDPEVSRIANLFPEAVIWHGEYARLPIRPYNGPIWQLRSDFKGRDNQVPPDNE
jgi:hypothetical protein